MIIKTFIEVLLEKLIELCINPVIDKVKTKAQGLHRKRRHKRITKKTKKVRFLIDFLKNDVPNFFERMEKTFPCQQKNLGKSMIEFFENINVGDHFLEESDYYSLHESDIKLYNKIVKAVSKYESGIEIFVEDIEEEYIQKNIEYFQKVHVKGKYEYPYILYLTIQCNYGVSLYMLSEVLSGKLKQFFKEESMKYMDLVNKDILVMLSKLEKRIKEK